MRKKYVILAAMIFLVNVVLYGCAEKVQPEGTLMISYLDKEQTKTVRMVYEPNADMRDTELLVGEFNRHREVINGISQCKNLYYNMLLMSYTPSIITYQDMLYMQMIYRNMQRPEVP